jgi:4-amino-4-deoxy-L-arabinose transferase-like glycosyltransferase
LILLVNLGLGVYRISYANLWSDEYTSLSTIGQPWRALTAGSYPRELNPPLYYLLLKGWAELFGPGLAGMRLFSLILAAGGAALMYAIGTLLGDWRSGLGSAAFLSFHYLYIFHAVDIRMYPLLVFSSLAALACYLVYTEREAAGPGWLAGMGLFIGISLYTHFMAVFLPAALLGISGLRYLVGRSRRERAAWTAIALSLLVFTPGFVYYFVTRQRVLAGEYGPPEASQVLTPAYTLALLAGAGGVSLDPANGLQLLSLAAVAAGTAALFRAGRKDYALALPLVLIGASWGAILISASKRILPRYLMHLNALAGLLIGFPLRRSSDRFTRLAGWISLAALLFYAYDGLTYLANQEGQFMDNELAARVIQQESPPDEIVVILGWDARPLQYYLNRPMLNSFDFYAALDSGEPQPSYLLVQSEHAAPLSLDPARLQSIFADPHGKFTLYRYAP